MKYILATMLVMVALIASALADGGSITVQGEGNSVLQSNVAHSSGDWAPGTITQTQSNSMILIGDGNSVTQSNHADAYTSLDTSSIFQDQSNCLILIGDENGVTQSNYAYAENFGTNSAITQIQRNLGLVLGYNNVAGQYNDAYAQVVAGDRNTITETQRNLGLQVGTYNSLAQYNDLDAGEGAFGISGSDIQQQQKNIGIEVGFGWGGEYGTYGNTLTQDNFALAYDYSDSNLISQTECNLAIVIGEFQNAYQGNSQWIDTWGSGGNMVDQIAANHLLMLGSLDSANQWNNQNAYPEGDEEVQQTAANLNLMLSEINAPA